MALKRRLQNKHIAQVMTSDSDIDTLKSEGDISPFQSDNDTEEDDRIYTGCRDWTGTRQS
jgi:hypothetical protein